MINSSVRKLQISALLIFIGINLRFLSENVFNALIFFNILQIGNSGNKYDIHTPGVPDVYGDAAVVVVFAAAYLLHKSASENIISHIMDYLYERRRQRFKTIRYLKNCIVWSKKNFFLVITGFGLYMVSKYPLSIGLEIIFIEDITILSFILNVFRGITLLYSSLIFCSVYCKYLFISKSVTLMMYTFFVIRNLFDTNVYWLITSYDLHVGAPLLDFFSPIIIVYSVIYTIVNGGIQSRIFHSLKNDKHEFARMKKDTSLNVEDLSLIPR
ncbi:MAG: hypothetical protein DYG83_07655 [Candidatus Brocadia sp. AMX2]|uniref:Uncharacterized protein n=1 Tax=Candidatus Brocadia sinica JPN1 TaxID=1197129 RepID=A0ABQ0JZM8_9BACT|nr:MULTISPECIES: hypothetical protein [Brocadia]KXK32747.1 MAG: hypothetical protein UZ01_00169 [Candidatus Brocadia sinica]MBC6931469.1 hypothetical protein [Candidatus Brocadia sp.]MBL1169144.1 hypothetical protein [Candidatus Brocadia sp. AMX1]NOG42002.1 hypothetical protein [Planctomycetota bacterium]KAA0244929.1 MAG: hypothetical protein EDM70_04805 [Candidatus Brocadia sp. AMX2]